MFFKINKNVTFSRSVWGTTKKKRTFEWKVKKNDHLFLSVVNPKKAFVFGIVGEMAVNFVCS